MKLRSTTHHLLPVALLLFVGRLVESFDQIVGTTTTTTIRGSSHHRQLDLHFTPEVEQLDLINSDTGEVVVSDLQDGAVVDISGLDVVGFNIKAEIMEIPGSSHWVDFRYSDDGGGTFCGDSAEYSLCDAIHSSEDGCLDFGGGGVILIEATPYSEADTGGPTIGETVSVQFSVVADGVYTEPDVATAPEAPSVTRLDLINSNTGEVVVTDLQDGAEVDISALGLDVVTARFNIKAEIAELPGASHWVNFCSASGLFFCGDTSGYYFCDIFNSGPVGCLGLGNLTIGATPGRYLDQAGMTYGPAVSITFSIVNGGTDPTVTSPLQESQEAWEDDRAPYPFPVGQVTGLKLVFFGGTNQELTFNPMDSGNIIDLSDHGLDCSAFFDVIAVTSETQGDIGSVYFKHKQDLNTVTGHSYANDAPYSLGQIWNDGSSHCDTYEIWATPYTEDNGGGTSGTEFYTAFIVMGGGSP